MQFNKELGNEIHEAKLKVLYVSPPQPPSPITESNEEEEDKVGPVVDNGDRHFPPNEPVYYPVILFSHILYFLQALELKHVLIGFWKSIY